VRRDITRQQRHLHLDAVYNLSSLQNIITAKIQDDETDVVFFTRGEKMTCIHGFGRKT
jgi:hypothetical protein